MDKRVLQYYEQELHFVRELGAEFARRFPKVAGRLGITDLTNLDPHVERLFQGFALLAGRVQHRLDSEFPQLTDQLLDQVYPHYLSPTPSMAIVQFQPTAQDASLVSGFTMPRGTELRGRSESAGVVCQFRTAHAVELWPIAIESIEYTSVLSSIADLRVPTRSPIRALLRVVLKMTAGRRFDQLRLSSLPLFVSVTDDRSARLYEALAAHVASLIMRWGPRPKEHVAFGEAHPVTRQLGLDQEHAMLPVTAESFRGYRLLHEYFAFPSRFHFVELLGLAPGIARCTTDKLELLLPLTHYDSVLEGKLELERLQLFAAPAVNLFQRSCDLISVSDAGDELQVMPDRTQPLDYEVHSITRVAAFLPGDTQARDYQPMHALRGRLESDRLTRNYTIERRPRVVPYNEYRAGRRTEYPGSEVFLRLSDLSHGGEAAGLSQLAVEALCTNRDRPLLLARDRGRYFTLSRGGPVDEVRCLVGPSMPRALSLDGDLAWRLVSHLSVNYLSTSEAQSGGEALREMLSLYARFGDPLLCREVIGIRAVHSQPVIRPYPQPGPRRFVRGLEVQLECEEQAFGHGVLTLAAVLSVFFAKYANGNSFTETVLRTRERGEVHRWPAVAGLRHSL
jgi:type VI secretion system protein ImpG